MIVVDDFIGSKLATGKGVLEVKEISHKVNYIKNYILTCSVCSQDEELWPYGSIISTKGRLSKGQFPCSCSGNTKWSEEQWIVRINRSCDKLGYQFLGLVGNTWKGKDTLLVLKNTSSGNIWEKSANNLVNRGKGDPAESIKLRSVSRTYDEDLMIERFVDSGNFIEGCTFKRLSVGKGRGRWLFECPLCKDDEYVSNCGSKSVFVTSGSSLLNGSLPCRCSKGYKWGKGEMLYRVEKLLVERGDTYIGVEGKYGGSKTIITWVSGKCNHINKTSINKIFNGQRCSTCFTGGFKNTESGTLYVVLWEFKNRSYIKYGITNMDTMSRCIRHKRGSKEKPDFKVLYEFHSEDGKEIAACEKKIKKCFLDHDGCPSFLLPEGFTETLLYTEDNLEKLLQIISTFNLLPSDS